jgi:hypothetical protein
VVENKVLRKIFVPKRDEGTIEWRKQQIEELRDLNFSPSMIRRGNMRIGYWWESQMERVN